MRGVGNPLPLWCGSSAFAPAFGLQGCLLPQLLSELPRTPTRVERDRSECSSQPAIEQIEIANQLVKSQIDSHSGLVNRGGVTVVLTQNLEWLLEPVLG